MTEWTKTTPAETELGGVLRGALLILLTGVLLGTAFNWFGQRSRPQWGVAWVGTDKVAEMPTLSATPAAAPDPGDYRTDINDPMAIPAGAATTTAGLPEVPDLDRPIQIELAALKQFVDASAVILIDGEHIGVRPRRA